MKTLKRYYSEDTRSELLELHCNHTLWQVKNENLTDDDYIFMVECCVNDFKVMTGTDLILTGRSGRHVCIEDNKRNQLNYWRYKKIAKDLENDLIKWANEFKPELV